MSAIESMKEQIKSDVTKNKVLLYMKGDRNQPMCGFSAQVLQILNSLDANYETRNVLADETLRQAIKEYSDWPTVPQLYVEGEFVGGCDIITELHQSGELKTKLQSAA